MAGVPLTLGFIGKDGAYEALLHGGGVVCVVADRSRCLRAFCSDWPDSWLVCCRFEALLQVQRRTSRRGHSGCRRSHWQLAGLLAGVVPWILNAPLSAAAAAILNTPSELSLAVWHGLSPALMLSALTLVGVGRGVHDARRHPAPRLAARAWHRAAIHRHPLRCWTRSAASSLLCCTVRRCART